MSEPMMPKDGPPSVDTSEILTVDLGGCAKGWMHCHRPRSARQEGSRNPDGIPFACHRPAGWGTPFAGVAEQPCKLHGGRTPGALSKGQGRRAAMAVATYGLPVDVEPLQALLDEVHRAAGHVAWLGAAIANLDADELTWGIAEESIEPDQWRDEGILSQVSSKYKAAPHVLVKMYMDERRQLVAASKEAIAAGASERMVSLYENVYQEVGSQFVELINRVLDRLDLSESQRATVPAAVVAELHVLAEGS